MQEYKYLSCVYGVDRKICHEGHWSESRGLPSDAEQWSRVTDFSIHTMRKYNMRKYNISAYLIFLSIPW